MYHLSRAEQDKKYGMYHHSRDTKYDMYYLSRAEQDAKYGMYHYSRDMEYDTYHLSRGSKRENTLELAAGGGRERVQCSLSLAMVTDDEGGEYLGW